MTDKHPRLRRMTALLAALALLICPAFAAEEEAGAQDDVTPLEAILSPISAIFQQAADAAQQPQAEEEESAPEAALPEQAAPTVSETPLPQQPVVQTPVYYPTYLKTVSYSQSLAVPALALQNSTYIGEYKITFYCPCAKCCGAYANGITASGTTAFEGRTIAVDPNKIPLGSRVYIEGLGDFIAEDVGGAVKNNKIDVFVRYHSQALQLGVVRGTSVYLMK